MLVINEKQKLCYQPRPPRALFALRRNSLILLLLFLASCLLFVVLIARRFINIKNLKIAKSPEVVMLYPSLFTDFIELII